MKEQNVGNKFELEQYLEEKCHDFVSKFDILCWWKNNSVKHKILSCMARAILGISISIVAFE